MSRTWTWREVAIEAVLTALGRLRGLSGGQEARGRSGHGAGARDEAAGPSGDQGGWFFDRFTPP